MNLPSCGNSMRRRACSLVWLAASSTSVTAVAQTKESDSRNIAEVIVTAQKRSERLDEVPISITVIAGDALDKSSTPGITDALNRVPGVVANAGGVSTGGTQLTMRGVGASGAVSNGSSPIGYYLDSVPVAQIRQSFVPDSNAYDLERVEVLRGPQGTLYGVNAENGLVRVLTQSADLNEVQFKARTTLSTTDGGGENYRGDLAVNVPLIAGKLAVRAVAGYQDSSGWIDQPNEQDINDSELRNYRLKVNAQPTESFSAELSAWRSDEERGAPSGADDNMQTTSMFDQPAEIDYEAYNLKLEYDFAVFSLASMTSYVDYTHHDLVDLTPLSGFFNLPFFTGQYQSDHFWSKTFAEELVATSTQPGPWRWTLGGFYRDTNDRVQIAAPVVAFLVDMPDAAESYAAFGEVSRRFGDDKFEWTLGARYFHDDVSSGQNVEPPPGVPRYQVEDSSHSTTPRAVLTWYPNSDTTVYASYAEGFRSSVPLGYVIGQVAPTFPAVHPDKLHNYEIGSKAKLLDGRLAVDAAVYFIDWQDVQQTILVAFGAGVQPALTNGDSASGVGIDLGVTARPTSALELGVSISWNDLQFDGEVRDTAGNVLFGEGERLGYSSEYTAGANIDYEIPLGSSGLRGAFSASASYSSEQIARDFTGGGVAISHGDDILIARTSFAVESGNDHWTATLFVDNVSNFDGIAGPIVGPFPFWQTRVRPRTTGVQLDYRF